MRCANQDAHEVGFTASLPSFGQLAQACDRDLLLDGLSAVFECERLCRGLGATGAFPRALARKRLRSLLRNQVLEPDPEQGLLVPCVAYCDAPDGLACLRRRQAVALLPRHAPFLAACRSLLTLPSASFDEVRLAALLAALPQRGVGGLEIAQVLRMPVWFGGALRPGERRLMLAEVAWELLAVSTRASAAQGQGAGDAARWGLVDVPRGRGRADAAETERCNQREMLSACLQAALVLEGHRKAS